MTTMTFPALDEIEGKLKAKRDELAAIFSEAGPDYDFKKVKQFNGDSHACTEHVRALNDEMTDLGGERDKLNAVKQAAERVRQGPPAAGESGSESGAPGEGRPTKTLGQMFVESKAYKEKTGSVGPESTLDVDLKTLFQTTAGFAPEVTRTGRIVDFATRPIQVADIIPQTTTGQSAVQYMEETTYTNTAGERAEGAAYPEATLALTERTVPVRKIAVFIPVTDEQLEDEPRVSGYLDNRLPFMIRQRLDLQLLVGDGIAPNLLGVLATPGIQTQAKGVDPTPDAVYKAITLVRTVAFAEPNVVVFNPTDWQDVRLLRTADGIYIWGNPSDAGPERIWGLNVVQAVALTLNTALVGDFQNFSELAVRRGMDVQVSNSHDVFFTAGKQAVRADIRVGFIVYRPAAFCQVTGV